MPQERESANPVVTPEEWYKIKAETPREIVAARAVVASQITGIPRHGYLVGTSDHAPVLQGVAELARRVYALVDAIDNAAPLHGGPSTLPDSVIDANAELAAFLGKM